MVDEKRKPPKLPPKESKGASQASSRARKSSVAAQRPSASAAKAPASKTTSAKAEPKKKPPKLPPKSANAGPSKPVQPQKPSVTTQNSGQRFANSENAIPARKKSTPGPGPTAQKRPSLANSQRQQSTASRSSLAPSANSTPKTPAKNVKSKSSAGGSTVSASGIENTKAAKTRPGPASRTTSTASWRPPPRKLSAKPEQTPNEKDYDETPAHRLAEENRDLKSMLDESQCADLTLLVANITGKMRDSVESTFDAKSGLKLIGKEASEQDAFENLDYDPATVDVGEYDKERKAQEEQEKALAKPEAKELKKAALEWFDEWREVVVLRVGEAVNSKETASEQKDETGFKPPARKTQVVQKFDAGDQSKAPSGPKLEDLFPRAKTSLTKLPMGKRVLVLHSVLLLLLSLEHYNAASRVLLLYLTSSLKLGISSLQGDEEKSAQGLLEAAKKMTAESETTKRLEEANKSRVWKIRLATAAGAAVIGYTGGLAAPMISAGVGSLMGELGLGATAAAGYLGTVAGSTAVVGGLFGAYGGRMTGEVMSNISAGVQDFAFLPIHGERKEHDDSIKAATDTRRLRVIVAISGWLLEKEEVVTPWRVLKPSAEVFALRFELEALMNLGQSFDTMLQSAAYGYAQSALVKRTVFAELMSAMWPVALVKVARVVDNPFSVAKTRADKAGEVLADALMNRVQGERPVTLVGYSLGARVIWSCLTSLAKQKAFGLVESAVLMGSPIASDATTWRTMRSVVSGRLVNVYSTNDYLLAFLYRTSSLQYGVAGLMPIASLAGVENVNVSETVSGHLRYRYLVGSILQKIRFEDIDKEEVAKEAKAFEAIVEEEKKRTYTQQAGELYDNYKGKKPKPRKIGQKKPGEGLSDADANKEATAMEKLVKQKTKTGLMAWAVEQLYLSRPSAEDVKKAAKDPEHAGKNAEKSAKKVTDGATKTLYQRAKEATYLSRSGGPVGKEVAEEKQAEAESTAKKANAGKQPDVSGSYLSHAAGYIPTGYIPSWSSGDAKRDVSASPKGGKGLPRRPSTLTKQQSSAKGSKSNLKKTQTSQQKVPAASKEPSKKPASSKKADGVVQGKPPKTAAESQEQGPKSQDQGPESQEEGSRMTDAYNSITSEAQQRYDDALNDPAKAAEDAQKGFYKAKDGVRQAQEAKETVSGYTSYLPSFGYGSKEEPKKEESKKEEPTKEDLKKDDQKPKESKGEEKPEEKPEEERAPPKESSGYSSYIPSFGFGSSGPKEDKNDSKSPPQDDKPDTKKEPEAKATDTADDSHPNDSEETIKPSKPATETPPNKDTDPSKNKKGKGKGTDDDPFTSPPAKGDDSPFTNAAKAAGEDGERKYPWEKFLG